MVRNGSERFGTVRNGLEGVQELACRGVARSERFGTTSGQIDPENLQIVSMAMFLQQINSPPGSAS